MNKLIGRIGFAALIAGALAAPLAGCAANVAEEAEAEAVEATAVEQPAEEQAEVEQASAQETTSAFQAVMATANVTSDGVIDASALFKERDLAQTADLASATQVALASGQDYTITAEGVYVVSGDASETTIVVEADDTAKVQIVLDNASITNASAPAIYVKSADKVFVTTTEGSTNTLQVTGTFVADGTTNLDAVIFSRDTLVLNGQGTLVITSTDNGISGKDDIRITGGTYHISSTSDAIEANDAIAISDGTFSISAGKDALHAENSEDDTQGFIYICGGTFEIAASSDALQATTYLQIDGGTLALQAAEGLEATYIQVNGGSVALYAVDDGVNASWKSMSVGTPTIEVRGGELTVEMAQGDTDALDSNGNIIVSGGTIDITAQFAFDFEEGTATYTGGTIYVNGEQVSEITNSMMMGGMGGMGGPGGMMPPGGMGAAPGGWG